MMQRNLGNGRATTLANPVQLGEGGISASQYSDLLPTERVLLCKTPGCWTGAYRDVYGVSAL